ncbi:MAG: hypothetical protein KF770_17640 [Anaerolineae bacterium]|nr:hypothetical protein [Anaerolineae bacterium]
MANNDQPAFFDRLHYSVQRNAETVRIQHTAVARYHLATYSDGLDAYTVEYWDNQPVTIRRAIASGAECMTRSHQSPPWI